MFRIETHTLCFHCDGKKQPRMNLACWTHGRLGGQLPDKMLPLKFYPMGSPIEGLTSARIDGDKNKEGIQEIKGWTALMGYVQTFEDKDNDGVAEIPERYRNVEGRQVWEASFNPVKLLKNGSYITWTGFGILVLACVSAILTVYIPIRIIRKKENMNLRWYPKF